MTESELSSPNISKNGLREIYVSSDWHLFHSNILTFKDSEGDLIRPGFSNVNEMNECILEHHNQVVKDNDIFYNLGDVFFGNKDEFAAFVTKFKGRKRLLVGNHDDIDYLVKNRFFQKTQLWRVFPEYGTILSHIPLHESSLNRGKADRDIINTHGHIHQQNSPKGPYVNVSMEKINYTPVNIEELHDLWKKQQEVYKENPGS